MKFNFRELDECITLEDLFKTLEYNIDLYLRIDLDKYNYVKGYLYVRNNISAILNKMALALPIIKKNTLDEEYLTQCLKMIHHFYEVICRREKKILSLSDYVNDIIEMEINMNVKEMFNFVNENIIKKKHSIIGIYNKHNSSVNETNIYI